MNVSFVLFLETNKRLAYTDLSAFDLFNEQQWCAYWYTVTVEPDVHQYETHHGPRQHNLVSIYDLHLKATQCYYSKLIRN